MISVIRTCDGYYKVWLTLLQSATSISTKSTIIKECDITESRVRGRQPRRCHVFVIISLKGLIDLCCVTRSSTTQRAFWKRTGITFFLAECMNNPGQNYVGHSYKLACLDHMACHMACLDHMDIFKDENVSGPNLTFPLPLYIVSMGSACRTVIQQCIGEGEEASISRTARKKAKCPTHFGPDWILTDSCQMNSVDQHNFHFWLLSWAGTHSEKKFLQSWWIAG